jgi:hypothetical protein
MVSERAAPVPRLEQAFLAFSIVITALQIIVMFAPGEPLRSAVTPYTGWLAALPYMMGAATWPSLYQRRVRTVPMVRLTMAIQSLLLLVNAVFGATDFAMFRHLADDPNPMLRYSPARPIWTVVIPLAWAAALWRARPVER